jgi:hypothetical protein
LLSTRKAPNIKGSERRQTGGCAFDEDGFAGADKRHIASLLSGGEECGALPVFIRLMRQPPNPGRMDNKKTPIASQIWVLKRMLGAKRLGPLSNIGLRIIVGPLADLSAVSPDRAPAPRLRWCDHSL